MKTPFLLICALAISGCATRAPVQLTQQQIDANACKLEAKKADEGNSTTKDALLMGLPLALIEKHKRIRAGYEKCMAARELNP
jgi:hypothetical protein